MDPHTNVKDLPPDELHRVAKALTRRDAHRHWTQVAEILGRIETEGLYQTHTPSYMSARAYAREEMDLTSDRYRTAMRLAELLRRTSGRVPLDVWRTVPENHALLIRRVVNLLGDPMVWIEKSRAAGTAEKLEAEIDRYLEKEPWVTLTVRGPESLKETWDASLVLALHDVVETPNPDPALIDDDAYRFRCLEVILVEYVRLKAREASRD